MTPPQGAFGAASQGGASNGPAEPVPRLPPDAAPRGLAALAFSPEVLLRAQGAGLSLKAAIFDVDGVLTDGRIYISEQGETVKAFNTLDGQGLKLLVAGGITPLIITGRDSLAVRRRVADLGLQHAVYGAHDKLAAAEHLLAQLGLAWGAVAAMGDDWPDLPLLTRAAFACAPANAHAEDKAVAHHVTAAQGGHGAAREFCDLLLMASGRYAALLQQQLTTLDGR
jgi:3-deoxy-D-manno-octulosonate 8-phosphate phosphatase (KDO 8-P phosphatase)